jgi:hypothetical protein
MKINKYMKSGAMAAAALALVCSGQRALAQIGMPGTETYTDLKFTFPTTGPTETPFNDPTWIYWYNTPGGNAAITTDPTTDKSSNTAGANTSSSGSLEVVTPWSTATGDTQDVFFGCFADSGSYNFAELADLTTYQSIDFDILVQTNTVLSSGTNYGGIGVGFCSTGYGYQQAGSVTIPSTASAGWVHLSVPINQASIGSSLNRDEPAIAFDYANYSGYPATNATTTFWIDNVELVPSTAPPAPPPTMTGPVAAIPGLNTFWTIPGANGQYNRYQIADTNDFEDGNDSFVGQNVTYSWTISAFPVADTGAQAHFFIVNGPDSKTGSTGVIPNQYDTAADYNFANCIFITVGSDGAGNGIMNLRYKYNDAAANDQIFGTGEPYASITNGPLLGTWSVNFNGGVVTLHGPSGATASYTLPGAALTAFSEASGPSTFLLGSQPNATTYGGSEVVYSSFSRTGNHAFTDNFATDSTLNTNIWENLSSAPGALIVPTNAAYWIDWTLPALNYAPVVTASLSPKSFSPITPIAQFPNNSEEWALLPASGLPAGKTAYFQVVQRVFSKLVVVLPGQTFTPGVAPGYSGTATPVDVSDTSLGEEDITVYAVDSSYNPVPGVTDAIEVLQSTDGGAVLPTGTLAMAPATQNANWSSVTFNVDSSTGAFYFTDTPGPYTITVEDTTTQPMGSPTIANATSAGVTTY